MEDQLPPKNLDIHVATLQTDLENLLKLLGGTAEERLRFWEIVKGITTPAVYHVVGAQVEGLALQTRAATQILGALKTSANELASGKQTAI